MQEAGKGLPSQDENEEANSNISYFVANLGFDAIYAFYKSFLALHFLTIHLLAHFYLCFLAFFYLFLLLNLRSFSHMSQIGESAYETQSLAIK